MKILALEFSSPQRSVAVADGARAVEVVETGAMATRAFSMIEDALRAAALEREQIECLAIGLGPGSYTGIRAAVAVAQGWQLARGVKLLGISSVDCLAAQAREAGLAERVSVVIDAQRGEFYLAGYELRGEKFRAIAPLRLATAEEVRAREAAGDLLVGPEVQNWFPSGNTLFPKAGTLANLAIGRTDFITGEAMEPVYLRETQFVKAPPPRHVC